MVRGMAGSFGDFGALTEAFMAAAVVSARLGRRNGRGRQGDR